MSWLLLVIWVFLSVPSAFILSSVLISRRGDDEDDETSGRGE
jgi:hypothetical protein